MTQYETTFIVNPQTDDATIAAQVKAITDIITNAGGKIVYENLMGTRRMAYPIKKLSQGYYANFIFDAPNTVVAEMDLHFRMNEPYLRHLTIVYEGPIPDPNAPPPEEYRGFGRPRGGYGDRPYGGRDGGRDRGRDGGRDSYRDRGRPEPATRRPEGDGPPKDAPAASTAPAKLATDKPAADTAPANPETAAAPETAPATPAPVAPAAATPPAPMPEPVKAAEPKPTPKPAAEPKPETPTPAPPVTPPKPAKTEEYREDEEL